MDFDAVELADKIVSSTPEQEPVRFSTQWPELFKGGQFLFGETVGGLTYMHMYCDKHFILFKLKLIKTISRAPNMKNIHLHVLPFCEVGECETCLRRGLVSESLPKPSGGGSNLDAHKLTQHSS